MCLSIIETIINVIYCHMCGFSEGGEKREEENGRERDQESNGFICFLVSLRHYPGRQSITYPEAIKLKN